MPRIIDAEVVSSPSAWEAGVPPTGAFYQSDALASIETLVREVEERWGQDWWEHAPAGLVEALDDVLRMQGWLYANPSIALPEPVARDFRAALIGRGRRVWDELAYSGGVVGEVAPKQKSDAGSVLGAALVVGGIWLLDRWLRRRGS